MVYRLHSTKLARAIASSALSLCFICVIAAGPQDPFGTWVRENPGPQHTAKIECFSRLIRATGNPGAQSGVNIGTLIVRRNSVDGQYRLWDRGWYVFFWPGTDRPHVLMGLPPEDGGLPRLSLEECRARAMPLMQAALPSVSFRVYHTETVSRKNTVRVHSATRFAFTPLEYVGGAWAEVDRSDGRIVDSSFGELSDVLGAQGPFVTPEAARAAMANAAYRLIGWSEVEVEAIDPDNRHNLPDTPVYARLMRVRTPHGPIWEYDQEAFEASAAGKFLPQYTGRVTNVATGWFLEVCVDARTGRAITASPFTSQTLGRGVAAPLPLLSVSAERMEGRWNVRIGERTFGGELKSASGDPSPQVKRVMLVRGTRCLLSEFDPVKELLVVRKGETIHAFRPTGDLLAGLRQAQGLRPKSFGSRAKSETSGTGLNR